MNDRLRGDELVLRIIQQLARGESLDRFIDALPPNHRRITAECKNPTQPG